MRPSVESAPGPLRDQRGATMVAGTFMAIFLVAVLYHLVGVGRAILYRERMQDFADRAAFEAAAGYARSMNEIALANNIQLVAVTNVFALSELRRNVHACAEAARWGGQPQDQCPPLVGPVDAGFDQSVPQLAALARETRIAAEALRDATPDLVRDEVSAMVLASGGGERRLVAAGVIATPMPLQTAPINVQCVRAAPFVRPLIESTGLSDELVESFNLPPAMLARLSALQCPMALLPAAGPQVMSPPNQSGTEGIQLRALVVGAEPTASREVRESGVRLAERVIGRGEPAPPPAPARERLRRLGLAQAEYYSAWEHANRVLDPAPGFPGVMPEENTFYMHWRARLRRLRVPVDAPPDASSDLGFAEFVHGPLYGACIDVCASGAGCGDVCGAIGELAAVGNSALQ